VVFYCTLNRNIVATVNLDCKLDLKTIAFHARNVEYNPKVRFDVFIVVCLCARARADVCVCACACACVRLHMMTDSICIVYLIIRVFIYSS
jgi:hypothetical protein